MFAKNNSSIRKEHVSLSYYLPRMSHMGHFKVMLVIAFAYHSYEKKNLVSSVMLTNCPRFNIL